MSTMTVGRGKQIARDWIREHVVGTPGVIGAVFHGSVNWLSDDAVLAPGSDLDILVVVGEGARWVKPGKFAVDGVLMEVSDLPAGQISSGEQVLGDHALAGSFRDPHNIIVDPTGHLTAVVAVVAAHYADEEQVRRRMTSSQERILSGFMVRDETPFPDCVIHWAFPAAVTTHVVLVAGLRNPTVRKRYLTTRDLLAEYGLADRYALFLRLIGADRPAPDRIAAAMDELEAAFCDAARAIRSPFPFGADISADGWPVAIGGSRDLIAAGNAREAVFWMIVTWSRCMAVLTADGTPDSYARHDEPYRRFLVELGITSEADLRSRHAETLAALPEVWSIAEDVLARNGNVRH
ncbi:MAG TPA: hypothetical protein VGT61_10695 [Thermomicrobiales bacterium]|jgi:hypothetical protein|nr:hypothetical protein [Thermomicrobiales bacterium]